LVVLPLAATVVAVFFVLRTASAARASKNIALELWSFAVLQFAVAAAALAWGVAFGWSSSVFRVFYLFGAVVNVVWLALGTIWLLSPRAISRIAVLVVAVATGYAAYAVLTASFVAGATQALAHASIPAPSEVMNGSVRLLSRWYSIGGSVVVIAGLLWSVARRRRHASGLASRRGRRRRRCRRRIRARRPRRGLLGPARRRYRGHVRRIRTHAAVA